MSVIWMSKCFLFLGGVQQLLAFAGALSPDQRVAAHDQPLPRELVGVGDLPEVLLSKQRRLEDPVTHKLLDRRRLQSGDPRHPSVPARVSMFAWVIIPRAATTVTS